MASAEGEPMIIDRAELLFLRIPFRMSVTHGAMADRTFSDSLIVKVASGGCAGYGEAVVREYVSGSLGGGAEFQRQVARLTGGFLAPVRERDLHWEDIAAHLSGLACEARELPILCAVETALLDLACGQAGTDVYSFLGAEPLRQSVIYGGVIPILPPEQAEKYVERYASLRFPNVKVKVGGDPGYNDAMLGLCRKELGQGFDIRVDANASWSIENATEQLDVCARHGVKVIEQPFAVSAEEAVSIMARAHAMGFDFIADEGVLTAADVASLACAGGCRVVNLRLSKNGGLSRVLALARVAEASGLAYQLGCMVGETGVLSALGRVAASLLPSPLYVEGSYDDILLSENITTRSFGFGPGGLAPIVRESGIGYEMSEEKLVKLSVARVPCP